MIKFEHLEVYGFEAAMRGMRNPMNSWNKSDSETDPETGVYLIGSNDFKLAENLATSGTDHAKFMRMINVTVDITAPRYWWTEFDTYKVGTVSNSCSTMHKIMQKEFTINDFSYEDIDDNKVIDSMAREYSGAKSELNIICNILNAYREQYLLHKNMKDWYSVIKLLPQSYNQKRTVQMNYAVLRKIYKERKGHKLKEWHDFREWIEKYLPYNDLITSFCE